MGVWGAQRPQIRKQINLAPKIGVWGVKTYFMLFWKYPVRGENTSSAAALTAQRDKSVLLGGLCRYALNESKHNVRRLEFSAGLGGIPPKPNHTEPDPDKKPAQTR